MNLEYFIAKRIAASQKVSFSKIIVRIAIATIALCLAVMIGATAMISGFKKEISDKIFGFNGHIQISSIGNDSSTISAETPPFEKNQEYYDNLKDIGQIDYVGTRTLFGREFPEMVMSTHGGVRHVQVYALQPGIIKTKENIEGVLLKGVGEDFDWQFMKYYLQEGASLNVTADTLEPHAIISQQTADRLELKLNDRFIINFIQGEDQIKRQLKIVGIYKTGLVEFDKTFALVDIRFIQQLQGWSKNQIGGIEVFLDDLDDLDVIRDHIYFEMLPSHLNADDIKSVFSNLFSWLEFQNINEVLILSLMIVVAIINMATVLLILIIERTNMIGILKAIGLRNWGIRKIFLYNAAWIIGIGLLLGNMLGLGFCFLEDRFHFITLSEENYYLSYAPIHLNFWTVILLNLGTLLTTVVFLTIPTYLVTKISPVKAIRFN